MFDAIKMPVRYAWNLKRFLQQPLTPEECRQRLEQQLQTREESFLRLLERGVFSNPGSPYRKLLRQAGVEFADVAQLIQHEGIDGTLRCLYKAGVYISLDEFKGRRPIQRSGLHLSVQPQDFDNPLLARHYEAQTGGSRSVGNRVIIDLDLLTHEAAYVSMFLTAFMLADRPMGMWLPVPPAVAGMNIMLRHAKLGKLVEKWFTLNKLMVRHGTCKYFFFTNYTVYGSRLWGKPLAVPEYVPLAQASQVARWLARKKEEGSPALLDTNPGSGVRVCLAAQEHRLDIAGTFFRFVGEPYTPAKARVVAATGSRAVNTYSMAEVANIGMACAAPAELDDVHLLSDKLAVIQHNTPVGTSAMSVGALFYTTLLPSCPKIMLNVESGDYGELGERSCGCLLEEVGFRQHLHTVRSYEKLTSEGMNFLGSQLVTLVEELLPSRFGGHPTDYQFVEEEDGGLPKVSIFVSPRVGAVDETRLVSTVLQVLRSQRSTERMMVERWREGQTLRVVRREPYATAAAKILPLHILQKRSSVSQH